MRRLSDSTGSDGGQLKVLPVGSSFQNVSLSGTSRVNGLTELVRGVLA